jgi:hypothetical protein
MDSSEFRDASSVSVSLTVIQAKNVLLQEATYTDRWDPWNDGYSSMSDNCKSTGYQ